VRGGDHLGIYTVVGDVPLIVVVDHRREVDDGELAGGHARRCRTKS
jgi:hypothetical protein